MTIIEKIHSEFYSASESALQQAISVLEKVDIEKIKALEREGFVSSKEVTDGREAIMKDEEANLIQAYRTNYPLHKFILVDQVVTLCKKYSLVCGPIGNYTSGLSKFGVFLQSSRRIAVPDPIILQPVKGGYLIVAAWGDEASDSVVVNEVHNRDS